MKRKSLCWSYLSKNKNNGVRVHYDFAKSTLTPFLRSIPLKQLDSAISLFFNVLKSTLAIFDLLPFAEY